MRQEAAVTFSTGFQVNLGAIACLVGKGDTVYLDKQDHACIIDGARLSFGDVKKFKHNDPADLRRQMRNDSEAKGRLVVVDGVFSMEGDIAPLPEIVAVAREFAAGVMVDDAHGIGVLGKTGRGTAEHFGLEHEVDLIMGTFSKSMASVGGFIAGNATVIDYIKHRARTLIFSAAPPPASAAAALATVEIMEREPERRDRLWENTRFFAEGLRSLGLDTGESRTPGRSGRRRRGPDGPADGPPAPGGGRLRQLRAVAGDTAGPRADPHLAHGHPLAGPARSGARRVREGRPRGRARARRPRLTPGPGAVSTSSTPATPRPSSSSGSAAERPSSRVSSTSRTASTRATRTGWRPCAPTWRRSFSDENPFFRHGEIQLFVARRGREDVGRIAAILDRNHNAFHEREGRLLRLLRVGRRSRRGRPAARRGRASGDASAR